MKARGKAYERKAVKHIRRQLVRLQEELPRFHSKRPIYYPGQWIKFLDISGRGYAQPDLFIHTGSKIVVFECKLTRHPVAEQQIALLYWPLLYRLFKLPLVGVEVFCNAGEDYYPHPEAPETLREALELPEWSIAEWHFLP